MKHITTTHSCWWRPDCSALGLCYGLSFACTDTDYRPPADGNSNGTARYPSPLCWDARVFCFIVLWISICRFRRMLRSSMCFAGWPLPDLCRGYPSPGSLDCRVIKEMEMDPELLAFQLPTTARWRGRHARYNDPSST